MTANARSRSIAQSLGGGVPLHVPGEQLSVSPTDGFPDTSGGEVFRGGVSGLCPGMVTLLLLSASVLPLLFVAVTTHHSEVPWSAAVTL